MEQAYDFKDLMQRLKARGLDLTEKCGKAIIEETFDWLSDSAEKSVNPYDDMARIIYPKAREFAIAQADRIDGKQG